jgi:hypothetical protein
MCGKKVIKNTSSRAEGRCDRDPLREEGDRQKAAGNIAFGFWAIKKSK